MKGITMAKSMGKKGTICGPNNIQEDHSIVQGVRISVTEEDIAQVSGLPTNGLRLFSHKHIILNAQQDFLLPREQIEPKGRGV
jgi:hypothetical protein